jgi:hypothetical protein
MSLSFLITNYKTVPQPVPTQKETLLPRRFTCLRTAGLYVKLFGILDATTGFVPEESAGKICIRMKLYSEVSGMAAWSENCKL